jgi:hypothetical protein
MRNSERNRRETSPTISSMSTPADGSGLALELACAPEPMAGSAGRRPAVPLDRWTVAAAGSGTGCVFGAADRITVTGPVRRVAGDASVPSRAAARAGRGPAGRTGSGVGAAAERTAGGADCGAVVTTGDGGGVTGRAGAISRWTGAAGFGVSGALRPGNPVTAGWAGRTRTT